MLQKNNKHYITAMLLFILIFFSFGASSPSNKEESIYKFGFSTKDALRIAEIDNWELIELADYIMDGNIYSNYHTKSNPAYEINKNSIDINWGVKYSNSPTTYTVTLFTLDMVAVLGYAYEETENPAYLERASWIILDWIDYTETEGENNKYIWYDHSTASRVVNLIYFLTFSEDQALSFIYSESLIDIITQTLIQHSEYLMNDNRYLWNTNHGVMVDRALIVLSLFLNYHDMSDEWFDKGISRLRIQLDQQFTSEMVHVENSPGYSYSVLKWFIEIEEFLNKFGYSLDERGGFFDKLSSVGEFYAYQLMPNGYLPPIGDTTYTSSRLEEDFYKEKLNSPHYTYALTQGREGVAPEDNLSAFPISGYVYTRSDWLPADDYENTTWLGFKAGYVGGAAHKHYDDLSFLLYSKGENIFIDGGMYNYETTDPYRQYLVSAEAHNTIMVDEETFLSNRVDAEKTGILDWFSTQDYDYMLGTSSLYDGVSIDRHIFYVRPDAMVIFDDIISNEIHEYTQVFHSNVGWQLLEKTSNTILIQSPEKNFNVRIKQFKFVGGWTDIVTGDFKGEFSYFSEQNNMLESTSTYKFSKKGASASFITLITIEEPSGVVNNLLDVNFANDEFKFITSDEKEITIPLTRRDREIIEGTTAEATLPFGQPEGLPVEITVNSINNNTKYFKVQPENDQDYQFAWYIYKGNGYSNGKAYEKIWYSDENSLTYTFSEAGKYQIYVFIKNMNSGEAISEGIYDVVIPENLYSLSQITENRFKVELNDRLLENSGLDIYAWYVNYTDDTGLQNNIQKIWSSSISDKEFVLPFKGTYRIAVFMRDTSSGTVYTFWINSGMNVDYGLRGIE